MAADRLDAYHIREVIKEGQPKDSFWTRIGVGFVNRDGSINLHLNFLPPDGKFHLRKPKERDTPDGRTNESEPGPEMPREDAPF